MHIHLATLIHLTVPLLALLCFSMAATGTSGTATLNYQLTEFATGHMNDIQGAYDLMESLCPTVKVPGTHGQYKKFDDIDSFKVYNTARGMGADPTRIQFSANDQTFNCAPQALEITVDEEERRQAGENNAVAQQLLDEGKIKALLNSVALSAAYKRVAYITANTTAVANRGNWSNPAVDPVDQLDEQLDQLSLDCGSMKFVKITLELSAWRTLRSHPLVKKRLTGVQVSEISLAQLRDMLVYPVDIQLASLSYTASKAGPVGGSGATAGEKTGKVRLMSGNVFVHYSVPEPTLYDPSPFKVFTAGTSNIMSVRSYMAPNGLYGGHFVDYSEDIEQTSALACRRLALS